MRGLWTLLYITCALWRPARIARLLAYCQCRAKILRSQLPKRLTIAREERNRLLRYGQPLGADIRKVIVICKLTRENDWGYGRILGKLRKLGLQKISATTVRDILKARSLELSLKGSADT